MPKLARAACVCLIALASLAGVAQAQTKLENPFAAFEKSAPLPGKPVPDFSAYAESLKPVKLSALRGGAILVLQWGCPT
jgi:hypothetical protein